MLADIIRRKVLVIDITEASAYVVNDVNQHGLKCLICPVLEYFRDLQTTANDVRKAERLDFLPEMQSKVTANCDNSSGTQYETWVFLGGGYILKSKKLYKQHM